MIVATYHRVSTRDQNPALAREELQQEVARRGWAAVLEVEETGSGAKRDRPGLAQVMSAARNGKIQAVMVWKLDRFGRSLVDLAANLAELRELGVRFIATSQGITLGPDADATAKFTIHVLAAAAELERELGAERSTMAVRALQRHIQEKGYFVGRKSGVRRERLGRPAVPEEDVARIEAAAKEGLSAFMAAKRLKLPESTVRRYMRRFLARQKPQRKGGS